MKIKNGGERQTLFDDCSFGKLCSRRICVLSLESLLIVTIFFLPSVFLFCVSLHTEVVLECCEICRLSV